MFLRVADRRVAGHFLLTQLLLLSLEIAHGNCKARIVLLQVTDQGIAFSGRAVFRRRAENYVEIEVTLVVVVAAAAAAATTTAAYLSL